MHHPDKKRGAPSSKTMPLAVVCVYQNFVFVICRSLGFGTCHRFLRPDFWSREREPGAPASRRDVSSARLFAVRQSGRGRTHTTPAAYRESAPWNGMAPNGTPCSVAYHTSHRLLSARSLDIVRSMRPHAWRRLMDLLPRYTPRHRVSTGTFSMSRRRDAGTLSSCNRKVTNSAVYPVAY